MQAGNDVVRRHPAAGGVIGQRHHLFKKGPDRGVVVKVMGQDADGRSSCARRPAPLPKARPRRLRDAVPVDRVDVGFSTGRGTVVAFPKGRQRPDADAGQAGDDLGAMRSHGGTIRSIR